MQSVMQNTLKLVKNINMGRKFPKEVIPYLLKAAESADNKLRNDIENQIVQIGEQAISVLVKELANTGGKVRALIAMSLIRIGFASIEPLKQEYKNNSDFAWVVNYITNEIEGSRISLNSGLSTQKREALAV